MNMINNVESSWILCKVIILHKSAEALSNTKKRQILFLRYNFYVPHCFCLEKQKQPHHLFTQLINLAGGRVQFH